MNTVAALKPELNNSKKLMKESEQTIDKLNEEIKKLESTLDESNKNWELQNSKLKTDLIEIHEVLEKNEEELCNTKELLSEKLNENQELLEQLDVSGSTENDNSSIQKAKGLIVADSVTSAVAKHIRNCNIEWAIIMNNDLDESMKIEMDRADIIVLLTGSEAIRKGNKGLEVFKKVRSLIAYGQTVCSKIVACEAPPTLKPGAAGHISLYNFKMSKMSGVQFLQSNPQMTKSDILSEEDFLNPAAVLKISQKINENITSPEKLKLPSSGACHVASGQSAQNINMYELFPLKVNQIGKIIGQRGETIIGLSKRFDVAMRVGKWYEPKKEKRDEYEEKMNAVLISGLSVKVAEAASAVKCILMEEGKK